MDKFGKDWETIDREIYAPVIQGFAKRHGCAVIPLRWCNIVYMARIAEKVSVWVAKVLLPEIRTIVKEEVSVEVRRSEGK